DMSRADAKDLVGDIELDRLIAAERDGRTSQLHELQNRLSLHDASGARNARWFAKAEVAMASEPSGARVEIARVGEDARRTMGAFRDVGTTPVRIGELESGTYLARLSLPGHASVSYPLLAHRGDRASVTVPLPSSTAMPKDYVLVPKGKFLAGS